MRKSQRKFFKIYIELSENLNIKYRQMQHAAKAVLREKFIKLNA